ncbi:ribose-5-phosphate isomerase A [Anaerobutyricum hallii]|uniref:ribose-5-phosphate isomerase A n=1 Tax=Anaerobutyricum hallii TaxID=39488 RepID=UPI001FAB3001|nr:ribose-5-phosphate isomerase A [Anaerobutyricum hallii]
MDTDFSNVAAFAGKPEELHQRLKQLAGVVETALFIDVVAFALCVCGDEVKVIEK